MTLLIFLHIGICVFLVCVILLQTGKSEFGIGFGSSSQSIFGSKGAGNFLTKTTSVCALAFLVTSFILTRSRLLEFQGSVIKDEPVKEAPKVPPVTEPVKENPKSVPQKPADASPRK